MAINLVSLVSQVLTPQLVGSLARAAGVNEAVAQKLVAAAIPTVLAALGTAAAAPGGAQKIVDAVSNSDPDLLTKLSGAIGGGNIRAINEGATLLGGILGGSGLSSLVGTLSQYSGAAQPAAQTAIGSVVQSAIGALGQQDPGAWSDPGSLAALFGGQKDAVAVALPPEIAKALAPTGLLAGIGAAAAQAPRATAASAPRPASPAAAPAASPAPIRAPQPAASPSSGFPMWAIILLIVVVLAAVWWFMTQNKQAEPAKQGMAPASIELTLQALPGPRA